MNKALPVLAVVAILGAAFFAGQKSFGVTVQYNHADVIDVVEGCGADQFIGGCKACKACETYEYAAGGCSYFKDTFCTLCTAIKNCPTQNIACSDQYDQVCTECEATYFIEGNTCQSCTICGEDEYVVEACKIDQDTECAKCPECGENEWVSKVCKIDKQSNQLLIPSRQGVNPELPTECTVCLPCDEGNFCDVECQHGDIHNVGEPTSCAKCEGCDHMHYATKSCTIGFLGQTECTKCEPCPENTFITAQCEPGHPFDGEGEFVPNTLGTDVQCQDCTPRGEGEWTVFPCNPLHTSDAVHQKCSHCSAGEYQYAPCTETSDTVCPSCPDSFDTITLGDPSFKSGLQYCSNIDGTDRSQLRCQAFEDEQTGEIVAGASVCGEWTEPIANQKRCVAPYMGDPNCGEWKSYCQDGFSGQSCCYHEHEAANCGTLTSRERNGRRNGFVAGTDFVGFCRDLCEEFPDCMAFEVLKEDAVGDDIQADKNTCYFKASYTQNQNNQWMGTDGNFKCFSNTCRQNSFVDGRVVINYNPEAEKLARIPSEIKGGRRR